ncbi:MAG: hypothetical protein J6P13_00195 [Kiritimatiellae bacterium]|nr:hypothetical protein [Kiritimatiellia bacterium]
MSRDKLFDSFYALKHVKFVLRPQKTLETFGSTIVNYHLVSELEDNPNKIRIREGRLEAHPPVIVATRNAGITVEGLPDEARKYLEYLRDNDEDFCVLRYGFHMKSDNFSEQIVTDRVAAVSERVKNAVKASGEPFSAVIECLDDPWSVAVVELWRTEVQRSGPRNIIDLKNKGKLF